MLRRGAALGAAVAVASPVVQGLGRAAAFAQVSPPPDEPDPVASYPSHFQVIFTVGGSAPYYGIHWDGRWDKIGGPPHGAGSRCWDKATYGGEGYTDASPEQMAVFTDHAVVTRESDTSGTKGAYVLDVSGLADVGITIVDAATYDGQYSGGFSGHCDLPIHPGPDGRYRFWKP